MCSCNVSIANQYRNFVWLWSLVHWQFLHTFQVVCWLHDFWFYFLCISWGLSMLIYCKKSVIAVSPFSWVFFLNPPSIVLLLLKLSLGHVPQLRVELSSHANFALRQKNSYRFVSSMCISYLLFCSLAHVLHSFIDSFALTCGLHICTVCEGQGVEFASLKESLDLFPLSVFLPLL